jgi:hypothetical protein
MHLRWYLFAALASIHVAVAFIAPDALAHIIAGSIYLPLAALQWAGIPVFATNESGGWPPPAPLGWAAYILLWAVIWWLVASLLCRLYKNRSTHT